MSGWWNFINLDHPLSRTPRTLSTNFTAAATITIPLALGRSSIGQPKGNESRGASGAMDEWTMDGYLSHQTTPKACVVYIYIYIVDGKNSKQKSWSFWKKITNIQGNKDDIFQLFLFINLLFFLFEGIRVEGFFLFWTTFFSFLVMGLFKILYFWSCWSFVLSCSSVFFVGGFEDFEVCKIHID